MKDLVLADKITDVQQRVNFQILRDTALNLENQIGNVPSEIAVIQGQVAALQAQFDNHLLRADEVEFIGSAATAASAPLYNSKWYYLSGHSIIVPAGLWDIEYSVTVQVALANTPRMLCYSTLQDSYVAPPTYRSIHSESHTDFTCATDYNMYSGSLNSTQMPFYKKRRILLASQTTWYLCIAGNAPAGSAPSLIRTNGDVSTTFIRAKKVKHDVE